MLDSFEISQFGAFKHLKMDRLAHVNLIVGKNNSGKTMLLEALRLYFADGRSDMIRTLLAGRDEVPLNPSAFTRVDVSIDALYHGRHPDIRRGATICLGPLGDLAKQLTMTLVWLQREEREGGDISYRVVQNEDAEHDPDVELGLVVKQGISSERVYPARAVGRVARVVWSARRGSGHAAFVPAGSLDAGEIGRLWDAITLRGGEDRVLKCLKLVTPIERISMVEHPSRSTRLPIAITGPNREPVSLRSMGDGVFRMFQIAIALESASTNPSRQLSLFEDISPTSVPILLDEIENGIHYSVLPDLWRFIFAGARWNGVQVFATTHSWDCIQAFQRAAAEAQPDESLLIRLEPGEDETRAVTIDRDELAIVTRDDIEVR